MHPKIDFTKIQCICAREVINIERAWSAVLLNIDDQFFVISWYKTADHALSIFITSLICAMFVHQHQNNAPFFGSECKGCMHT